MICHGFKILTEVSNCMGVGERRTMNREINNKIDEIDERSLQTVSS